MNQFNTFVRLWAVAGGAIMLLIVAVTAVNVGAFALDVALRSFGWRIPALPGYEDFVRLAIGPALLMLFPYCQLQRGHIAADFFTARLSSSVRRGLDLFWAWITAALAVFLGYSMLLGMWETYDDNALSQILGWRQWPFYLPAVISLFLCRRRRCGPTKTPIKPRFSKR